MEEENEREEGGGEGLGIEGDQGEKLNFEVYLTSFTFIKFIKSVTHVSIYRLAHRKLP